MGDIKEVAQIKSFAGDKFIEFGPANLTAEVLNNSNVHIRPEIKLVLSDLFGRRIDEKEIAPQNIFPGTSRFFEANLGNKFMIGPYKASLLGSYGENKNLPLAAEFTFWVVPWRIGLLTLLILILLVLFYIYQKGKNDAEKIDLPKAPIQY